METWVADPITCIKALKTSHGHPDSDRRRQVLHDPPYSRTTHGEMPHIVFDVDDEYFPLWQEFDYVLISGEG